MEDRPFRCSPWLNARVRLPEGSHGPVASPACALRGPARSAARGRSGGGGVRRVAMLSVHTSPLHQPGTGDAGGMNVYIVELAKRLAAHQHRGRDLHARHHRRPPADGRAGPRRPRPARGRRPLRGAGQGGPARRSCAPSRTASCRPGPVTAPATTTSSTPTTGSPATSAGSPPSAGACPLVHAMHTMAKVKNAALAEGDTPEPAARVIGETQIVRAADRLIANTAEEADELVTPLRRRPRQGRRRPPGRQPRPLPPRPTAAPPPAPASACRRTP